MKQAIYAEPIQPYSTMAYKFGIALLNWIGIPTTILGIVANWGDIKGTALFILSLIFLCVRVVFYVDEKLALRRSRKIENDSKELDLEKKRRQYNSAPDEPEQHY